MPSDERIRGRTGRSPLGHGATPATVELGNIMAIQITPTGTQHVGMAESPIGPVAAWLVTFQLEKEAGLRIAISIPVEGPITHREAQQLALKELQTFLTEASEAAQRYHIAN